MGVVQLRNLSSRKHQPQGTTYTVNRTKKGSEWLVCKPRQIEFRIRID
jgi:hypothetical protein